MPTYRVFINKKATGDFVTGTKAEDAYINAVSSVTLSDDDDVQLSEVKSSSHSGKNTLAQSIDSITESEL